MDRINLLWSDALFSAHPWNFCLKRSCHCAWQMQRHCIYTFPRQELSSLKTWRVLYSNRLSNNQFKVYYNILPSELYLPRSWPEFISVCSMIFGSGPLAVGFEIPCWRLAVPLLNLRRKGLGALSPAAIYCRAQSQFGQYFHHMIWWVTTCWGAENLDLIGLVRLPAF